MTVVSRSDVYMRSEKGPSWFDEFLKTMAEHNPSSVRDIMDTINDKRGETVESVVQSYREQVGLDAVSQDVEEKQVKQASFRPLSIRHASMGPSKSMLPELKKNPAVLQDIDSLCQHSGGTKNTMSIISHLRDKFGRDLVSFSDKDLKDFIDQRKSEFRAPENDEAYDVGLVGQEHSEEFGDDVADYQMHDGVKR